MASLLRLQGDMTKNQVSYFSNDKILNVTNIKTGPLIEYYVLAGPKRQGDYAILTSQRVDTETTACMGFYFSLTVTFSLKYFE